MDKPLQELEAWLDEIDPPHFPTESEIEVWEWLHDIAQVEQQAHPRDSSPPDGGDVLSLFGAADA